MHFWLFAVTQSCSANVHTYDCVWHVCVRRQDCTGPSLWCVPVRRETASCLVLDCFMKYVCVVNSYGKRGDISLRKEAISSDRSPSQIPVAERGIPQLPCKPITYAASPPPPDSCMSLLRDLTGQGGLTETCFSCCLVSVSNEVFPSGQASPVFCHHPWNGQPNCYLKKWGEKSGTLHGSWSSVGQIPNIGLVSQRLSGF